MIEYMYAEGVLEFLSERPQLARALRAKPIEVCWRLLPAAEAAAVDGEEERAQGDQGRISVMHGLGEDSDDSDDSSDIEDLGAAHPPPPPPPFVTPTILIHPAI